MPPADNSMSVASVHVRAWAPPADNWISRSALVVAWLAVVASLTAAAAGAWFVGWLVLSTLLGFLLGPGSPLGPDEGNWALLLAPPALGTAVSLAWFGRRGALGCGWLLNARQRPFTPVLSESLASRRWTLSLIAVGLACCIGYLRLVFLYHRIHGAIDEGMYLYAARLVTEGRLPYRDFYFDQAPLLPFILGPALWPFHFREEAARLLAIACTLATLVVTYAAAARIGGRLAGLMAFGLLVANVDFLTEVSAGVPANGSITALVVALTMLALAYDWLPLALVLATVAAGLRQSFLPLPVLLGVYVAFARGRPRLGVLGGMVLPVTLYGFFFATGGEAALYGLLRPLRAPYIQRWMNLPTGEGPRAVVISIRNEAFATSKAYLPFLLASIPVGALAWTRRHPLWALFAALLAANWLVLLIDLSPYPGNPRYPVTQLPMLAVLAGVGVAWMLQRVSAWGAPRAATRSALATAAVLVLAGPLLATRNATFVQEYRDNPPVAKLNEVSDYVRSLAGPNATLLTLETPFASQTGLRLPPGLEDGSWGIYSGLPPGKVRHIGGVTFDQLIQLIDEEAGDVAISSDRYGFKNYAPSDQDRSRVREALDRHYELRRTFRKVSDWGDVRVYTRRPK